jgi:hypothetical protein
VSSLEETTTPELHHSLSKAGKLSTPIEHTTSKLSSAELGEMLAHASQGDTLSLHRVPEEQALDGSQDTEKWSEERIGALLEEANRREQALATEQLSSKTLENLLGKQEHTAATNEQVVEETVKWEKGAVAQILSEHEAAALLEMAGPREDDEALLDVPDRQSTEQVSQEELDTIMELATKTRPRQGKRAHEILEQRAQDTSPPKIALLEEKMPPIRKAPTGHYQSMIDETPSRRERLQTLLLTLLVIVGLGMVGALLFHMWPR